MRWLAGYGAGPLGESVVASMVGSGAETLVKRVITAVGVDAPLDEALARFLSAYDQRLTHHTRPYEGIPALLGELQATGIAMAVLTNKPLEQSVRISMRSTSRNIFGGWSAVMAPGRGSRHPMAVQFLMQQAGAEPSETVLVGIPRSICRHHERLRGNLHRALWIRVRRPCREATCAATNGSSTRPPRFPECWVQIN
jgi:phosphoglycolate phosphatase-like HAD superfamily hydrolase